MSVHLGVQRLAELEVFEQMQYDEVLPGGALFCVFVFQKVCSPTIQLMVTAMLWMKRFSFQPRFSSVCLELCYLAAKIHTYIFSCAAVCVLSHKDAGCQCVWSPCSFV